MFMLVIDTIGMMRGGAETPMKSSFVETYLNFIR
jgi:hypothetical protein